jgi:hypothetical protein
VSRTLAEYGISSTTSRILDLASSRYTVQGIKKLLNVVLVPCEKSELLCAPDREGAYLISADCVVIVSQLLVCRCVHRSMTTG